MSIGCMPSISVHLRSHESRLYVTVVTVETALTIETVVTVETVVAIETIVTAIETAVTV